MFISIGPQLVVPRYTVKCPLETSAKDGPARRLSPYNCVPIENMAARSPWTQRQTRSTKLYPTFYHAQKLSKPQLFSLAMGTVIDKAGTRIPCHLGDVLLINIGGCLSKT